MRPGQRVVDLGCWPGGWLQVASQLVGTQGRVVGADLAAIDPPLELANVTALVLDLGEESAAAKIREALGAEADVVLCDAAPKLTGVRAVDRANEENLLTAISALFPKLLRPGGSLIVKLLECPEAQVTERTWRKKFREYRLTKPDASRKGTTERYFVGVGFEASDE